jgi:hypothetical protein
MTDDHDPLDPLDDLASAVLDGTATPEEMARASTDPLLAARVEQLRIVRDALRADHDALVRDGVHEERREQAIAAALAAYDDEASLGGDRHEAMPPATLARRRVGMVGPRTWLVGIAAAVALLALAVPLLGALSGGDDQDTSDQMAAEVLDDAGGDDDSAGAALDEASGESCDAAMSTEAAPPAPGEAGAPLPHLGTVPDSWPALADAVAQARLATPVAADSTTSSAPATGTTEARPTAATCRAASEGARFAATVDYGGKTLLVLVLVDESGAEYIEGLDPADCSVVLGIAIDG